MALSDVLNNLTGARDALVTAINNKGGTVATSATLRQCADAVMALPEGGGEVWEAPEGAVLYLPLSAPFGLNPTNTVNFGEVSGIQCASFPGNACFNLQTKPLSGTGDFSVSLWENFEEANANEYSQVCFFGNAAASRCVGFHWVNSTGKFSLNTFNSDEAKNINVQIETKSWHHIAAVYSSGTLKLFVDNALKGYATVSLDIGSDTSTVGGLGGDSERNWAGGLAGFRVYDRAITEAEISTLYDEFVNRDNPGGGGSSGGGATSADLVDLIERDITSIEIPEGTTEIGYGAFSQCSSLNSVSIPDGVTKISQYAFSGCTSLTSVVIPGSVTTIESDAFANCFALYSLIIRYGVTNIGNGAFLGCASLTLAVIPNSVTEIGVSAFAGCRLLASVTIPDSVLSIGKGAFSDCDSLADIYCGFAENAVPGAPWGAPDTTTIHYNA